MDKKFQKKEPTPQPANELQGGFANRLKKTGVALTTQSNVVNAFETKPKEIVKEEPKAQPVEEPAAPIEEQVQETQPAEAEPGSPEQEVPQQNGKLFNRHCNSIGGL